MQAGILRHRATLRKRAETSDGHGGWVDAPAIIAARIPAFVQPISEVVRDRYAQIDPRATHQVTLRYRRDVSSGLELIYHDAYGNGDRTFEVVGRPIDVEERHEQLQVHCMEAAVTA